MKGIKRMNGKLRGLGGLRLSEVLLFLLFMAAAIALTPAASAGWDYYREIEINSGKVSGSANLNSFPVLINLSADWLEYKQGTATTLFSPMRLTITCSTTR